MADRITTKEWHLMGDAGLFGEDARVELLDGEVRQMSPIGTRHAGMVFRLTRLLGRAVGDEAGVSVQNPTVLDDWSEPQPDLLLVRPRPDDYMEAHPVPEDLYLLIEVSDSSLAYDRDEKAPRYAATGVPETWIVDLDAGGVIVMRSPSPAGYQDVRTVSAGETLDVEALPGVTLAVSDLFRGSGRSRHG